MFIHINTRASFFATARLSVTQPEHGGLWIMNSTVISPLITLVGRQKLCDERDRLRARLEDSEKRLQQELEHRDDLHWYATQQEISQLRSRIEELESFLEDAPKVSAPSTEDVVTLGRWVTVRDEAGSEHSFIIVAPIENDAAKGYISFESPVGAALIGRRPGETVSVRVPKGERHLSILSIR
jgi:transcription elongation GreA/GreB family factor